MSRHLAFLDEILAHPEDDLPRLVYADWLDEQGDPRGEFIRIQCLLAKLAFDDDRRWSLKTREALLKRQFGKGWANPIRHLVRGWEFHRGFVEGITIRAADFLEHAETLFQSAPICRVRLLEAEQQLSALAASPWLDRITSLDLRHNNLDWYAFADLAYSPSLVHLKELNLRDTGLCNDQGVRMLAKCEYLHNLAALDLSQYRRFFEPGILPISPNGLRAMADSSTFKKLKRLSLAGYGDFGAAMVAALAESTLLGQLDTLDISHNGSYLPSTRGHVPDVVLDMLFQSPRIANLRHLCLVRNHVANSAPTFAASPYLRNLQSLSVGGTWLGTHYGSYIRQLANTPNMKNVVSLNLSGCTIDDNGYREFFESDQFHNLKELNLNETQISNGSLRALAASPMMENLRSLSLQGSDGGYERSSITAEGLAALLVSPSARRLEVLDLGNQPLGNDLQALADSELAQQLVSLGLWKTGLSEEAVSLLCDRDRFPALELLDVRSSDLSEEAKAELRDHFGAGVRYGPGPQVIPAASYDY